MKLKTILFAILFSLLPISAVSQTTPFAFTNNAFTATGTLPNSTVRIVSGATIRVCTEPASGTPCTPLATIYTDATLAHIKSNPFQADTLGNYTFFVPAGTYHVQQSGPQVAVTDIPYIQFGAGGGGGGTCPSGQLYDIQINDPLGTCGSDPGIGYLNPNIHELGEWTGNFAQQVDVSDTTHSGLVCQGHSTGSVIDSAFCTEPSPTFSPTPVGGYGLFPPDNVPTGIGQSLLVTSLTSTSIVTKYGTIQFYPTHWGNVGSAISAEDRQYLFNNTACNDPATCPDIPFTPVAWSPNVAFMGPPTNTDHLGFLGNTVNYNAAVAMTTHSVTLPNVITAGDPLVVLAGTDGTPSIADSCGNTFILTSISGFSVWRVAHALSCLTQDIITVTLSGSGGAMILAGEVINGGDLDAIQTSAGSCSGGSPTTINFSAITTTTADILIGFAPASNTGSGAYQQYYPSTDFTIETQLASFVGGLGTNRSLALGWQTAATVGSNQIVISGDPLPGGSFICPDTLTMAFKPSSTGNANYPTPRLIRLKDLQASGDLGGLADGNFYWYNGLSQALVSGSFGTGLSLNETTGVLTASGSGDTITSPNSTISIGGTSSHTTLDVVGSAGKILAGATPALTFTPALGVDGTAAGTLQLANSGAAFHTILSSGATANYTFKFPPTAGTNTYLLKTDGSGNTDWVAPGTGGLGTVTSVAMTGDGVVFNASVTGSPITGAGTLVPSLHTQTANKVLAGPTSGGAATPTFRALVNADLTAANFQSTFPAIATAQTFASIAPYAVTFPANFSSPTAKVRCGTNPGGTVVFTLTDVTTSTAIGTVSVSSSCVGTFATTGGTTQTMSADDFYTIVSGTDATAVNVSIDFRAVRN